MSCRDVSIWRHDWRQTDGRPPPFSHV